MANTEHIDLLTQGVDVWNKWRADNPGVQVDLSSADLSDADLSHYDLSRVNLFQVDLPGANLTSTNFYRATLCLAYLVGSNLEHAILREADLSRADLSGTNVSNAFFNKATLCGVDFTNANLSNADLRGATLNGAYFRDTILTGADVRGADIQYAVLVDTNLENANLSNCQVYGISVWNINSKGSKQQDIIITPCYQSKITVDNLKVAQFIYLLIDNKEIRDVIDTITSKVVLILGRFTDERKKVLDAIRMELRRLDYTPILFDFEKPNSRDLTGTIELLSRMARFIMADLTDPSSIPHELATIVPLLRTIPVQPIQLCGNNDYSLFDDFRRGYDWVLPIIEYRDCNSIIIELPNIISNLDKEVEKFQKMSRGYRDKKMLL